MKEDFLTENEAAAYLSISAGTLRNARSTGAHGRIPSPKFFKIGRLIRYAREDLDSWIRDCRAGNPATEKQTA